MLDKSVIIGLPFCFCRVQCANLSQWFSDLLANGQNKNNQLDLESLFMAGYVKFYWKCTKIYKILQLSAIYPRPNWKFSILKHVDDV